MPSLLKSLMWHNNTVYAVQCNTCSSELYTNCTVVSQFHGLVRQLSNVLHATCTFVHVEQLTKVYWYLSCLAKPWNWHFKHLSFMTAIVLVLVELVLLFTMAHFIMLLFCSLGMLHLILIKPFSEQYSLVYYCQDTTLPY